jgi:hypothetical protein
VPLQRQDEIRLKLGDDAPQLDASHLHPWVWDSARSLWQSGHYREAIGAAAIKLNSETQNKIGRRSLSEAALLTEVFSENNPKPGVSRLHIVPNNGSKDFANVHRGARAFAEGIYAGIRNPNQPHSWGAARGRGT